MCGYSLFTNCSFDSSQEEHNFYRGVDCLKNFWPDLVKHAAVIINYEKKEMLPMTDEDIESYNDQTFYQICKKEFYDADDRKEDSDYSSNSDRIGEEFDDR